MQPKTAVTFDRDSFERIKNTVRLRSVARANIKNNSSYAANLPEEIGIQLTYQCNLRCHHCYQWSDDGFFNDFSPDRQKLDLDPMVIEQVLKQTQDTRANLFLWGGEPLMHREWEQIAELLERYPRWSVMCTNALLLEKKMESILKISKNLALLISIDGFAPQNDAIRGAGTFNRIIENVLLVKNMQKRGEYKGTISLYCVLNDHNAASMFSFMEFAEGLNIDTMYFGFPWHIATESAYAMDQYYKQKLTWIRPVSKNPSWYSYTHHIAPGLVDTIQEQINRINSRQWKIRIRLQPAIEDEILSDFLYGGMRTAQNRTQCLAVSNRLDIHADGNAGSCKFFPELAMGNLYQENLLDIWRGDRFTRLRQIVREEMMPICSKCVLLYLNGI